MNFLDLDTLKTGIKNQKIFKISSYPENKYFNMQKIKKNIRIYGWFIPV